MIVQQNVNLSKLIVLKDNYLARRLVISLFSAALWSPATEATSRGRRREERREEEEAIVRLVRILGEQQAEPSSSKLLKSGQGIARWVELSWVRLLPKLTMYTASPKIGTSGPNCRSDLICVAIWTSSSWHISDAVFFYYLKKNMKMDYWIGTVANGFEYLKKSGTGKIAKVGCEEDKYGKPRRTLARVHCGHL